MGMSGLRKPGDKETKLAESSQASSAAETRLAPGPAKRPSVVGWAGFSRPGNAQQRKKGGDAEGARDQHDDDRGIRFTISGADRRMTKDDFLKEVQKLERSNREVPNSVQAQAAAASTSANVSDPVVSNPHISVTRASDSTRAASKSPSRPSDRASATSPDDSSRGRSETKDTEDVPETAAERRRRLAAFASVQEDDNNETPAERRRREAALGVVGTSSEESDSDDDDTPRVPPERRGIRFAEGPARRA